MDLNLNLPHFDVKLRKGPKGTFQIFDMLRNKFVALTPEEWVRQHFVDFIITHRGYPRHYMANEVGITHNMTRRRCDTVVYDHHARPLAIIEYKSSEVKITESVFDQIVRYNMVLDVKCLMVSNGLKHYCCIIDKPNNAYVFLHDIPDYQSLIDCELDAEGHLANRNG